MNDFSHQFQPGDVTRWPRVSLGEVCEINPRAPKGLPGEASAAFIPMAAVSEDGSILREATCLINEVRKGYTYFKRHDVLLAKITPCFENGKASRTHNLTQEIGFASTEFHVLRATDRIFPDYVFHLIWNSSLRTYGAENMTGSAGQKRLPKDFLQRLEIPLPPLDEQRRIAAILDKADALRRKRKRALELLDGLTQSIFLEMFGDPAQNPHAYPNYSFREISTKISDGPFGSNLKSSHYVEDGVRVVRLQNIGVGKFLNSDKAYVSEQHFASLSKHECLPGDILVGTLGDPNLRACIQPEWLPRALNKADCVQIRVAPNIAVPEYVSALINHPSTERMAQALMLGQTRTRISMGRLRDLRVPIPPLNLQMKFATMAREHARTQKSLEHQLQQLETLFTSLQSRAFSGQL